MYHRARIELLEPRCVLSVNPALAALNDPPPPPNNTDVLTSPQIADVQPTEPIATVQSGTGGPFQSSELAGATSTAGVTSRDSILGTATTGGTASILATGPATNRASGVVADNNSALPMLGDGIFGTTAQDLISPPSSPLFLQPRAPTSTRQPTEGSIAPIRNVLGDNGLFGLQLTPVTWSGASPAAGPVTRRAERRPLETPQTQPNAENQPPLRPEQNQPRGNENQQTPRPTENQPRGPLNENQQSGTFNGNPTNDNQQANQTNDGQQADRTDGHRHAGVGNSTENNDETGRRPPPHTERGTSPSLADAAVEQFVSTSDKPQPDSTETEPATYAQPLSNPPATDVAIDQFVAAQEMVLENQAVMA